MKLQYISVILVLIILNIFLLFNLRNNKNNDIIKGLATLHVSDSLRLEQLECLINTFNNSNIISDSIKKNVLLFNTIHKDDRTKIVLHFGEGECSSCVKECILDLLTVVNIIGKENIIITGSFKNDTSFYSYANKIDDTFLHIPFKELNITCGIQKPLILVIDKNNQVKAIYISDLLSSKNRYTFFNKTLPSILKL